MMRTGSLLALVAVTLIAAGCATAPPGRTLGGRYPPCNENVCFVKVHVDQCRVSADPPTLEVQGSDRELHWDLDDASSGYTFAPNGIVIQADTAQEFTDLHPSERNRKFTAKDRNSFSNTYKYEIRVLSGGTACPVYDPWIYNN